MEREEFSATDILEVHRINSSAGAHYGLLVPLQITLEDCTGVAQNEVYAVEMTSTTRHYYHMAPTTEKFAAFNSRPPHQHNYFEMMFVLKGEITQEIEDQEYLYPAGSCCIINRNIRHAERFRGRARLLFLGFSVELVQQLERAVQNAWFPKEQAMRDNPIITFLAEDLQSGETKTYLDLFPAFQNQNAIGELCELFAAMQRQLMEPQTGATAILHGLLLRLFDYLGDGAVYHSSRVELGRNTEDLIFLHITHLLEDTHGRMTRSALEQVLNYSGNYLNSVVVRHTGLCLFDYGMQYCMDYARQLLTTTDLTVQQIAAELNFTNRTHFYKLFAEHTGMTPRQYRLKNRPEQP